MINSNKNKPEIERYEFNCSKCGKKVDAGPVCPDTGVRVCIRCCLRCKNNKVIKRPGSVLDGQRGCSLKEAAIAARGKRK